MKKKKRKKKDEEEWNEIKQTNLKGLYHKMKPGGGKSGRCGVPRFCTVLVRWHRRRETGVRDDRCAADGPRAIHHHRLSFRPRVVYCTYTLWSFTWFFDFFFFFCYSVFFSFSLFLLLLLFCNVFFVLYMLYADGEKKYKNQPRGYVTAKMLWPPQQSALDEYSS